MLSNNLGMPGQYARRLAGNKYESCDRRPAKGVRATFRPQFSQPPILSTQKLARDCVTKTISNHLPTGQLTPAISFWVQITMLTKSCLELLTHKKRNRGEHTNALEL